MKHTTVVTRNAAWLIAQPVFTGILSLVVTAVVARHLGTANYGMLLLLLSAVALFAPLTTLGLRPYSVREIAADRDNAARIVEEMVALRLGLSVLATVLALAYHLFRPDQIPASLLVFFVLQLMLNSLAGCFVDGLSAIERMRAVATVMVLAGLVVQGGCLLAVYNGAGLVGVAAAYTLGSAATCALAWRAFVRHAGRVGITWPRRKHIAHVRDSWQFFVQNLVATIRARADVIVINGMLGAHAAGVYGAGRTLIDRLDFLQDGVATALFPRAALLHREGDRQIAPLVRGGVKVVLVIATPVAVGLQFVSEDIMQLLFGSSYRGSGAVLRILGWGLPFMFAYTVLFNALRAMRMESRLLAISAFCAPVAVAAIAAGIALHGLPGAAMGWSAGYALVFVLVAASWWQRHGTPMLAADAAKLVAANGLMALVLVATADLPFAVRVAAAAVTFAVAVLGLRIIVVETLRSAFGRQPAAHQDKAPNR